METNIVKLEFWCTGKFFTSDDEDTIYDDDNPYHWRVAEVRDVFVVDGRTLVVMSWHGEHAAYWVRNWSVLDGVALYADPAAAHAEADAFNKRDNKLPSATPPSSNN